LQQKKLSLEKGAFSKYQSTEKKDWSKIPEISNKNLKTKRNKKKNSKERDIAYKY
jgi:hypothetical protein